MGDPKQSIYRFRRADIAVYDEVKRLIEANGGEVLPRTANFRTVPSVPAFVNERFDQVFREPEDPQSAGPPTGGRAPARSPRTA